MGSPEDSSGPKALMADFQEKVRNSLPLIRWGAALLMVALLIAVLIVGLTEAEIDIAKYVAIVFMILFTVFGLGLVGAFFTRFRGIELDDEQLNSIINYCYAYIAFSLLASFLPFIALPLIPQLYDSMTKSPVGIVAGCSVVASPVERLVPKSEDKSVSKPGDPPPAAEGKAAARSDEKAVVLVDDKTVPKDLRCDTNTDQWVVNIGGTVSSKEKGSEYRLVEIRGGLVVPLYVVILSLMGAVVSMTRRVPEFQRRISRGDAEHITHDQAREGLVFQIMQVASALLIAITAYYLVDPSSRASTIVLSFAAGFSSETVLLLIRAILEKLKPAPAIAAPRSASVGVAPARLDFGGVPVKGTSKKQVSIINPGPAALQVGAPTCSGEFATSTGPFTVAPQTSGVIEVEFKPTTPGLKQGQLTITDNATGSPRSVELSGNGTEPPDPKRPEISPP